MPITTPMRGQACSSAGSNGGWRDSALPRAAIAPATATLAARLGGEGQLHFSDAIAKVVIFVSRQDHCLVDLLWRTRSGELPMEVALVAENGIELVILAKYMQVLSAGFLERCPAVINIHHSFLPAFQGAQPYHRAWERGVKLIGATAHFVTEELDGGPIIEQVTMAVSHRDEVEDLIRLGRDTERLALARAVRPCLPDRLVPVRAAVAGSPLVANRLVRSCNRAELAATERPCSLRFNPLPLIPPSSTDFSVPLRFHPPAPVPPSHSHFTLHPLSRLVRPSACP